MTHEVHSISTCKAHSNPSTTARPNMQNEMEKNNCNQTKIITHIDLEGQFQTKYDCSNRALHFSTN